MTSIARLKDRARKLEQKEDWQAAIQAYQQVLDKEEQANEVDLELGLYNRIGDLHLRLGQTDEAVSFYEKAADKYAESGFFNNAIALCNKALRHRPDRSGVYLKLSRLCAEQGFLTDARRWILEYAERRMRAGQVEEALTGLEDFADLADDPEVRESLAQQLASHDRPDEAVAQLRLAHRAWLDHDRPDAAEAVAEKARAIDPAADLDAPEPLPELGPAPARTGSGEPESDAWGPATPEADGAGTDTVGLDGPAAADADSDLEGLETHRSDTEPAADAGTEELEGVERAQDATPDDAAVGAAEDGTAALGGLETFEPPATREAETEEGEEGPLAEEPVARPAAEDLAGEEVAGEEVAGEEVAGEEVAGEEVVEVEEVEGVEEVEEVEEEEEEEEEAAEPLPLLDTGHDLGEEGPEDEEAPEPLPLLEGAYTDDESGQEEPGEAGTEAPDEVREEPPAAELPLDELQPLPPMDLTSAGELEEPSDDVPEHIEGAMDLDLGAMSLGLEADEAEVEDLDVDAVIQRGRELVSRGLWGEALRELRLLSGLDAEPEVFKAALQIVNEVVRNDANNVEALQGRVEYAARTGDDAVLVNAYMDLADALARLGSETKARVMYERVLDMDPENEAAREALGVEGGVEPTIDLDAVLREMGPDELEEVAARKASDPDFAAMLSQFKAKVTERVEVDDGDHYDLGLAFKEMGLIDEAIGEFQAALKGGTERLKVYEELGQCFMQKSQYNVALKVFKRALQVPYADESELLGVYYHMGQCHEELGQRAEAREAYRKVLAIDETFRDVPDRVARL